MNALVLILVVGICITSCKGDVLEQCWPHIANTLCSNIEQQCSSSQECSSDQICCRYECGTICLDRDKVVREAHPLEKCWQFNSSVVNCLRFDMICESNNDCASNQICCEHECGKMCRDIYIQYRIKRDDTKTCPPGTGLTCTTPRIKCHTNDECIDGNICCRIGCESRCI